jgi:hypothetical protein
MAETFEYYVSELASGAYVVAKFKDKENPEATYTIVEDRDYGLLCSCPRWLKKKTVSCRHTELVREWIAGGKPFPYCKKM